MEVIGVIDGLEMGCLSIRGIFVSYVSSVCTFAMFLVKYEMRREASA